MAKNIPAFTVDPFMAPDKVLARLQASVDRDAAPCSSGCGATATRVWDGEARCNDCH